MNHACGSTLCRYPFFPLPPPPLSFHLLCLYFFSSLAHTLLANYFFTRFFHLQKSLLTMIKHFHRENYSSDLSSFKTWRRILYKSFARVENLRNRVIVPQERTNEEDAPSSLRMRSVYVSCSVGTKRIVPSRDSRKLVVMATKIRKEHVIFTRQLSPKSSPTFTTHFPGNSKCTTDLYRRLFAYSRPIGNEN